MKKTLIAGAASLAMAALPFAGVMATDPAALEDELQISVNESCTFTRGTGGSASFQKTMQAGEVDTNFGTNTFTSQCNNGLGYTVTAEFTALTEENSAGTAISYDDTNTPSSSNLGIWNAYKSGTSPAIIADEAQVLNTSSADPAGGTSFTVVYRVSLHDNQEQGTYTGTATYTLAQKSS